MDNGASCVFRYIEWPINIVVGITIAHLKIHWVCSDCGIRNSSLCASKSRANIVISLLASECKIEMRNPVFWVDLCGNSKGILTCRAAWFL
jgi:hypothetical protein